MRKQKSHNAAGNEPSQRQLRVGEQLRQIISETLRRGHFNNVMLLDRARDITVAEVRPSPDLKYARVYISVLGTEDLSDILPALNDEAKVFQRAIGNVANLKFTPKVRFVEDESLAHAQRIEDILREVHISRDEDENLSGEEE